MIFNVDDIIKDVRIAIDENSNSDILSGFGDTDTLSLNEIIRSKIEEGVKITHCSAPAYLLDGGNNFASGIHWNNDFSGWALLPEDFMRLVVFQMSDWSYPVYSAILSNTPEYRKQFSRFKGIKGNCQRPICAISIRPEGRVLEFFSCNSKNATVTDAVYIPYPKIDEHNGIDICERCYSSAIYIIASLALLAIGEDAKSKTLSELANNLFN